MALGTVLSASQVPGVQTHSLNERKVDEATVVLTLIYRVTV